MTTMDRIDPAITLPMPVPTIVNHLPVVAVVPETSSRNRWVVVCLDSKGNYVVWYVRWQDGTDEAPGRYVADLGWYDIHDIKRALSIMIERASIQTI